MLTMLRKRLNHDEDGFTLIELMVVVLIIAILIAIAIPTFLGAQDRARDRGTQSDLRNALTAAKVIATDSAGLFTGITASSLGEAEGALDWGAADGSDGTTTEVGWDVDTSVSPNLLQLSKISASGKAFGIRVTSDGQVSYCSSEVSPASSAAVADTGDTCADPSW